MPRRQIIAEKLFKILAIIGRPFGGFRPHRLVHKLSKIAYEGKPPKPEEFQWYKDHYGLLLKLHPYFLIDREIIAFGSYEPRLQKFISKNITPGMVCIDVGANIGAVSLHLALQTSKTGMVYAFEPLPSNARRLREHTRKNELDSCLKICDSALSDKNSELELLVALPSHPNQGMASLVEYTHGDLIERVTVKSETLDSFCASNQISRLDFIKVDIQGAEPLFLEGARKTLQTLKPKLIMEVAPSSMGSTGYTSNNFLSLTESLGYNAFLLGASGQKTKKLSAETTPPTFGSGNVLFEPKEI